MNNIKLKKSTKYIYWCYTKDHCEDWFIIAHTKLEAKSLHANYEGYDEDQVIARMICEIPTNIRSSLGWPTEIFLKKIGFEFIQSDPPRKVKFQGKIYKEGTIMDSVFDHPKLKQPLVYLMKIRDQNYYKIGYTKNLSQRKFQLTSNSPFYLDIIDTIICPKARLLEGEIINHFNRYVSSKEWLLVDDWVASVLQTVFCLYRGEFSDNLSNHKTSDFFNVTIKELESLIKNHMVGMIPSKADIHILRNTYEWINKINNVKSRIETKESLINEVNTKEEYIKELKNKLIEFHCPVKINDIITGDDNNTYRVTNIHTHTNKDRAAFFYSGYRVKKNGEDGAYREFILLKKDN